MAIYSCSLKSIGKTTHAAGTAGAHIRYIAREGAAAAVFSEHMPQGAEAARTWMDQEERAARKNARVCDKIMVALPRELDAVQQAELVRDYLKDLTQGQVPWFAAIHHDKAHNPHAHIVIRDVSIQTRKRHLRLSDSPKDREKAGLIAKPVDWIRERWEHHANAALTKAGIDERIDRRTLEAQGVERVPTIHVGPNAKHIDENVAPPQSQIRVTYTGREIDYPIIDAGKTRRQHNAEIIDLNIEREARSADPATRAWAQFEREQRAKDRVVDNEIVAGQRRRTAIERRLKQGFQYRARQIRKARDEERAAARAFIREKYAAPLQTMKSAHRGKRDELADTHSRLSHRLMAFLDFTGRTRKRAKKAADMLEAELRSERITVAEVIAMTRIAQLEAVDARHKALFDELNMEKRLKINSLKETAYTERQREQGMLQEREAERESARVKTDKAIKQFVSFQKKRDRSKGRGFKL
ncbi:MAG: MobA/MobL family protein [Pseudomonadota bacterium]